jgi:hypothetical protein
MFGLKRRFPLITALLIVAVCCNDKQVPHYDTKETASGDSVAGDDSDNRVPGEGGEDCGTPEECAVVNVFTPTPTSTAVVGDIATPTATPTRVPATNTPTTIPPTPTPTATPTLLPTPTNTPVVVNCRPNAASINGVCWYRSTSHVSCTDTCNADNRGGYNIKTFTYAGSGGSNAGCVAVVRAFGFGAAVNDYNYGNSANSNLGAGCFFKDDVNFLYRVTGPVTIPNSAFYQRFCACGPDF